MNISPATDPPTPALDMEQRDLFDGVADPFGRFMPLKDVVQSVGLSKAMIYRLMKYEDNPFPRPIKIGTASFWLERDVIAWKSACVGDQV